MRVVVVPLALGLFALDGRAEALLIMFGPKRPGRYSGWRPCQTEDVSRTDFRLHRKNMAYRNRFSG
jgi:hypothetical protein